VDEQTVHRRRWFILGVLVLSLLIVVLDNTILNVALKTIADPRAGLGASQSQLQWAVDAYVLVFAGLLFTWGVLADRYGRRRMLLAGMVVFGAGSTMSAFAQSPAQLIGFRAIMGIGAAAVMPATLSVITNVFDSKERGRAIAVWAGASGLAIAIGPITGGLLLEYFWWGSVFLVNVPIVLLAIVGILLLVPESKDPRPRRLDVVGVMLSIAGLVLVVYGIIRAGQSSSLGGPAVLAALLAGLALLAVFGWVERRSDHPSLDIELFRDPRFSAASTAIALAFFALMGTMFFLVFYLQSVRGYSPLQAGVSLLPVAVAIMFFAPRSARLVARFGARAVCGTGLAVVAVAYLGYQTMGVDTPIWHLEVLLFLQGAGMGNVVAPATESIMSALPRERAGAGSAVNNTMRQVGGALGVAILGSLLSVGYRTAAAGALTALPAPVRGLAGESIEATLAAVGRLGPHNPAVVRVVPAAKAAFVHAMHLTALGTVGAVLLAMVVVLAFLPGRPRGPRSAIAESEPDGGRHRAGLATAESVPDGGRHRERSPATGS